MTEGMDYRQYLEFRFDSLDEKLDKYNEQTKTLSEKVEKHEGEILELKGAESRHILSCPVAPKLQKLEKGLMEYDLFLKHPKTSLTIFAAFIIVVFVVVYEAYDGFQKLIFKNVDNTEVLK